MTNVYLRELKLISAVLVIAIALSASQGSAKPKAAANQPPVTIEKSDVYGTTYRQVFAGEAVTSGAPKLSIATLHWFTGGAGEALEPERFEVWCSIDPDGSVDKSTCRTYGKHSASRFRLMRMAHSAGAFDDLPKFDPTDYAGEERFFRSLRFRLQMPRIEPPDVDLTTGPLVDASLVIPKKEPRRFPDRYPSKALRLEASGTQSLECQVQIDYSVICRPLTFDPSKYHELFKRAGERFHRNTTMKSFLADGGESAGVRFRTSLVYRLD